MITSTKKRLAFGLVVTAAVAAASIGGAAKADPKQYSAAVGVGSDTVQAVMNAMAGNENGINYTPIQSDAASGARQVVSFNALGSTCISPKINFGTFTRPNGSTQGRRALSRSIDGTKYGSAACGGVIDVSGEVDFARSSAGPAAGDAGTALTYIPFGRDAVTFAYYQKTPTATSPTITTLSQAQLVSLFSTGPQTIGGTRIVPCGIQLGSGTYNFWLGIVSGNTAATEAAAVATCLPFGNNATLGGRLEENDALALQKAGDALAASSAAEANTEVIIGFSAANYAAESNGVSAGTAPQSVNVGIGSETGLTNPLNGTAGAYTPNSAFYASTTFGRNVYTVWDTSVITSALGNADLKSLFVGSTSSLCNAVSTINTFGFLGLGANCGTTTTKGSLIAGQL
jgi:ABC-type phosphate transport system substrate-binding protein